MINKETKVNVSKDTEKYLTDLSVLMAGISQHLNKMPGLEFTGLQKFTATGLILALSAEVTAMTSLLVRWGFIKETK